MTLHQVSSSRSVYPFSCHRRGSESLVCGFSQIVNSASMRSPFPFVPSYVRRKCFPLQRESV